jgi:hypothetical protein
MRIALAVVIVAGSVAVADPLQLVVTSPGSPGTTGEAQPRMDAFAKALSARARTPIAAVYDPSDAGGVKRIESAAIAIVSLPFFLEHEKQLGLHARLQLVQKGRPALERWALVAQKGRIKSAAGLAGFTIVSNAAYAPGFVRVATAGLGRLPANIKLEQSTAVLTALRKAAAGQPIAVLLDGTQEAALSSLPFAVQLEVITRSPAMPAGLVVTIDSRLQNWSAIEKALVNLRSDPAGAAALDGIQLERFAPLDDHALATARAGLASTP